MQSSASASLTFPSPFSFKRRLPASENDKIEHVKQGIMFHQPILFPTQGPSGGTNSYLCSSWPRQGGLGGGGTRWEGGHSGTGECPTPILGCVRGCVHATEATVLLGALCPRCRVGLENTDLASGKRRGSGVCRVGKTLSGCTLQGWGIFACCPAPGVHVPYWG